MDSTFKPTGVKAILHALAGILSFIVSQTAASLIFLVVPQQAVAQVLVTVIRILLLYAMLSLYCNKVLHISLRDCRVCRPRTVVIWLICAVALPLLVSGFFVLFMPGVLHISGLSPEEVINQLVSAVFGVCIAAGITEELVFRGFIMHVLEARWGKLVAVTAPSIVFGLLHIMNMESPNVRDILMLLIAGTCVGIMFSMITYQSGSIWPSAAVHGIWNLIIIGGILDIGVAHQATNLYTYTLMSDSTLMTGGAFGIEASVPAIIGYALVIILASVMYGRKAKAQPTILGAF